MKPGLTDLSAAAIARAIEANRFELLVELGRSARVRLRQEHDIAWYTSDFRLPMFNRVICARFESGEVSSRVRAVLAGFRMRRVPALWHTGPSTRPAHLGQLLKSHGLTCVQDEPGMAVSLLAPDEKAAPLPDLKVERVSSPDGLKTWSEVFALAFDLPAGSAEAMSALEADLGVTDHRRLYLGLLGGEPVATSMLFLGAEVAGLYAVGTLAGARQRGVARAMTMASLAAARDLGYRIGVLNASEMARGLYHRLGFREHCRLRRYLWRGT